MALLDLEDQDSELLARKHNWVQASVPMDIDQDNEAGIKRHRDEEELYYNKKQKTQPGTVFIPIANQPMDLAAEVNDDEDSLCEALANCNIGSQESMDQFEMDLDD
jgi:hypothetical protein